jgi:hypothetical protein
MGGGGVFDSAHSLNGTIGNHIIIEQIWKLITEFCRGGG